MSHTNNITQEAEAKAIARLLKLKDMNEINDPALQAFLIKLKSRIG